MKDTLSRLHDDFVLVPADNAANNVIVLCKKCYIDTNPIGTGLFYLVVALRRGVPTPFHKI